jgi:hypothetical protein
LPDWLDGVCPSLGGGGSVAPDLPVDDRDQHMCFPLGSTTPTHDHPMVAAVTRAAAAGGRSDSGAGPVLRVRGGTTPPIRPHQAG